MTSIQPKIGFTKNGNEYQKTTKGRDIGTKIGAAYAGLGCIAGTAITAKQLGSFIQRGPIDPKICCRAPKVGKDIATKLISSKAGRAGIVGVGLAIGSAVAIGLYAGLGRLIGAGFDALVNKGAKAEADRRAAQEV